MVFVQDPDGSSSEPLDAALGQIEVMVKSQRWPVRKQHRCRAHEHSRVAIEPRDDEHSVLWGRYCHAPMFYASGPVRGISFGGLWRHSEFVKLWAGHTISRFGSEISQLAIPLTAALVLNASPAQMGLLGAFEFAPFLLLSLFAGVWVDRWPRRPILIVADVGRALLLGSIPVAAIAGALRIEQLYLVGTLTGTLTVFFDVADQSY